MRHDQSDDDELDRIGKSEPNGKHREKAADEVGEHHCCENVEARRGKPKNRRHDRRGNACGQCVLDASAKENGKSARADECAEKLNENLRALTNAIVKAKPASAKGQYVRSCTAASTMGPGVKVNAKQA